MNSDLTFYNTEPFIQQYIRSAGKGVTPDIIDAFNGANNIFDNYSDYSNNCIIKIAKDHNIVNWINKHEEVFNKLR